MPTWAEMQAARKEQQYPELSGGNMLLKKDERIAETNEPIECQRVMLQRIRECKKMKINRPEDVVELLKEVKDYDRERGIILHLDVKNNVVGIENISTGSLNASIIHPREAIKGAIINSAANIIFAHNHPSGDPMPSVEDRAINKKLQEAFNIVGITMLDSVIIGRDGYYSASEHGELFAESKYKESKSGDKIMESNKIEIELDEQDACGVAMEAAMDVVSERCSGDNEPEEGRFLRMQIKQEIKHIHALALGTVTHPGHTAQSYAEHTIKLIDNGAESELISPEFADVLKRAVQKAQQQQPYLEVMGDVGY